MQWIALAYSLSVLSPQDLADPQEVGEGRPDGRVIVIGLEGVDGRWIQEGTIDLPNLRRWTSTGTVALLEPCVPIETPASWAAIASGQHPYSIGVPGFVMGNHIAGTVFPNLGHIAREVWRTPGSRVDELGSIEANVWTNRFEADAFWDVAARAGLASEILFFPQSFGRPAVPNLSILGGLSYPDALGGVQSFWVLTDHPLANGGPDGASTGSGGHRIRLEFDGASAQTALRGPVDPWRVAELRDEIQELERRLDDPNVSYRDSLSLQESKAELQEELRAVGRGIEVPVAVERTAGGAHVELGGVQVDLAVGAWSELVAPVLELGGRPFPTRLRMKLLSGADPFVLYFKALNVDPAAAPAWQPYSQPAEYAAELSEAAGPFETIGWRTTSTMALKDEVIDIETLVQDVEIGQREFERVVLTALERSDARLFVAVDASVDHLAHMTAHLSDSDHPLFDAGSAKRDVRFFGEEVPLRATVPALVRAVDRFVGRVAEHAKPEDTILVLSDHAVASFRRQVHLNNWLLAEGFLARTEAALSRATTNAGFGFADWQRTRAYSLGLGAIYLNLKGREQNGQVDESEAESLLDEIEQRLFELRDPQSGSLVVASVHRPFRDLGAARDEVTPDLVVGFAPPYRISWASSSGGLAIDEASEPAAIFEDNPKLWSGDHVSVDPASVPGLFASNRRFDVAEGRVHALDVAPTVLRLLGVAAPEAMARPALEVR